MKQVLYILAFGLAWALPCSLSAQQYTINGNAIRNSCNCYTLTSTQQNQSGSVWNNIQINLSQPFDFVFDVRLGCVDASGADGIAFILQPISTSVGTLGGGLGFGGVSPSIGITLDTYQNTSPDNDPSFDHIAIQTNGVISHSSAANNLAGPVAISSTSDNVEDCNWHSLRVKWDPLSKTIEAYFDGVLRVTAVKDLVADIFGGNPMVYWGFTGSTGFFHNEQQFCTALRPAIKSLTLQKRCVNEPIVLYDSTVSFAPIIKRYWDFGDGSPIDSVSLNPTHSYATPGNYTVTLTVIGTDGCSAVQTTPLTIGSKPVASFSYNDSCEVNQITFTSTATAQVGTINQWYWDFGNGSTANTASAVTSYPTGGIKTIRFFVQSQEGCASDTLAQPFQVWIRPTTDFTFTDSVCLGTPMQFFDNTVSPSGPVAHWLWQIDGQSFNSQNLTYTFSTPGSHTVTHGATATANAGCLGLITKTVFVSAKPVAAIKALPVLCQTVSASLTDSSYTTDGTFIQQWLWLANSGQSSTLQNPMFTFANGGNDTIQLVVQNSRGCNSDTLKKAVVVNAKPLARFGMAGSLCANNPLSFTDSSSVGNGAIAAWHWQFSNGNIATQQNTVQSFAAGPQNVALAVTSQAGCQSDTARLPFVIKPRPQVSFTAADGCVRDTIRFNATANAPISAWIWNYGDGVVGSAQPTSYVYAIPGSYTATLVVRDTAGCFSDTAKRTIDIGGSNANAGPDVVAATGQPVQLQAGGGILYQWTPADGLSNPNIANPIATPAQTTTYTVRAFTSQGCASTDQMTITVYKGPDIYVPTAFSPNADGRNDVFRAIPIGIVRFENLSVFNRYGEKIFFTSNAQFGWDGTWQGKKQPQGTYVWMVGGTDYRGQRIFKKGSVLLIR
jgi:gliding motility-associated-like protein